jgi:hypothetical protein
MLANYLPAFHRKEYFTFKRKGSFFCEEEVDRESSHDDMLNLRQVLGEETIVPIYAILAAEPRSA